MVHPDGFREGGFRNRHGLAMHYRDYGGRAPSALPVVCLAGMTQNCRFYHRLALRIAQRHGRRVLALDFRGHGRSQSDPQYGRYNWQTHAADVGEWLAHLGVPRAVAVGTSMGGAVLLLLAAAWPERFGGLVLNDVGPELPHAGIRRMLPAIGRIVAYDSFAAAARKTRDGLQWLYPDLGDADWERMVRDAMAQDADGRVRPAYDPNLGAALREQFSLADPAAGARPEWRLWDQWRAVAHLPTLVLRGERSDILPRGVLARMQETHPAMRCREVPGRAHTPLLDEPAATAAIDEFIAGLP